MTLGRRRFDTPPTTPVSRATQSMYTINTGNNSNGNICNGSNTITSPSTDIESYFAMSPNGKKSPAIGHGTFPSKDFSRAHLSISPSTANQIISCAPRPVLQALLTNSLSGLSELRTVTTLFLKFDSFSFEEFTDNTTLDEFFINMQKCLFDCGGMLRQFLIDDKGCVLIGLWGVPTASHAANCSKAIRCAVMMQNVSKDLGYKTSIGVTTGSVYCGIVGTEYRRDYVAIGGSVNLAARLMCKANGKIFIDDETFRRLPLNIACYTFLTEPLELKGIQSGAKFHCYWAKKIPLVSSDLTDSQVLVFESYLLRDINKFIENENENDSNVVQLIRNEFNERASSLPFILRERMSSPKYLKQTFEFSSESILTSSSTKILILKGTSGSGKTSLTNYIIKKIVELTPKNSFLAPLYLSLTSNDDNMPFSTIKKLIEYLLAWIVNGDRLNQLNILHSMILASFPMYSKCIIRFYLYPLLRETLDLKSEWSLDILETIETTELCPSTISHENIHLLIAQLLYFMLSSGIPVLAIDNVHFMCSDSWIVITHLCRIGCAPKIILTIRVHESGTLLSSDTVLEYAGDVQSTPEADFAASIIELSNSVNVRSLFTPSSDSPSR